MAKPTDKSPEIEELFTALFGVDRRGTIKSDVCVAAPIGCGGPATEFRDELSRKEYTISGLCQKCQDAVFGVGDPDYPDLRRD